MSHWNFAIVDGGQFHGIGDSGIDLFKGDPTKSLTREICQNSIDARVDANKPVRVEFHSFSIPAEKIPGRDQLLEVYKQALEFCKQQNFKKAIKFFERSIPLLEGGNVSILRISDFNTKGLSGADEADENYSSRWFRLVRSVGSSDKPEGSIGAYGSGKLSAFGCSILQTVFYSTNFINDNGKEVNAFEGVSKLICHKNADGKLCSDVGYFCENNSMPIMCAASLDPDFNRTEPGTDVYILGFKNVENNWQDDISVALLDGFLYAILENHLLVKIDNETIDSSKVKPLVTKYSDQLQTNTLDYYEVLRGGKATTETYSYLEKDDVELTMLLDNGLHKRVGIVRYPGMKVFDKGNISTTVSFAGFCLIKGKEISTLLGGMENIQHNKWEISRYDDDPKRKKEAEKYRNKMFSDMRDLFNRLKGENGEDDIDPDIGDCLPDPFSDKNDETENLNDEVLKIKKTTVKTPKQTSEIVFANTEGELEEENPGAYGTGGESNEPLPPHPPAPGPWPGPFPGPEPGPAPGPNPGENPPLEDQLGDMKKATLVKAKLKERVLDAQNGRYRLILVPSVDISNGYLQIAMAAESESYKADVLHAELNGSTLPVSENVIGGINLGANQKGIIDVTIDYSDICSMEVRVYGY